MLKICLRSYKQLRTETTELLTMTLVRSPTLLTTLGSNSLQVNVSEIFRWAKAWEFMGKALFQVNNQYNFYQAQQAWREFQGLLTLLCSLPFSVAEHVYCVFLGSDLVKGITVRGSNRKAIC